MHSIRQQHMNADQVGKTERNLEVSPIAQAEHKAL